MQRRTVSVQKRVLQDNELTAQANRELFARCGVLAVNLIASPGAGKTTLLVETLKRLRRRLRLAVIEGDIATDQDADRVAATDVSVRQIETGGACHLSARQVAEVLAELPVADCDLLLIENVGNLVCPASFDLGEHMKVALLSMPEGDDKPSKYPGIFSKAAAVVVTKVDLAEVVDFDLDRVRRDVTKLNRHCRIMVTSARTGQGLDQWCDWLIEAVNQAKGARD